MAINATLQIDLLGQCGSRAWGDALFGHRRPGRFRARANRSRDGKAFIVLPSTAKEGTISRIVPTLATGTHVTTGRTTSTTSSPSNGVAQLRGKSARQRCDALIAIATRIFARTSRRRRTHALDVDPSGRRSLAGVRRSPSSRPTSQTGLSDSAPPLPLLELRRGCRIVPA